MRWECCQYGAYPVMFIRCTEMILKRDCILNNIGEEDVCRILKTSVRTMLYDYKDVVILDIELSKVIEPDDFFGYAMMGFASVVPIGFERYDEMIKESDEAFARYIQMDYVD